MGTEHPSHVPQRATQSIVADVGGPDKAFISGYCSQTGRDWLHIRLGTRAVWIERVAFAGQAREADATLSVAGIVLIGSGARAKLLHAAAQISEFMKRTLIERPGWTGPIYALPDGTLYPRAARGHATAVFTRDHERTTPSGSVRGWREEVAAPLAGLNLASFTVMVPFAALLRDLCDIHLNQGYELVGKKGCGKSTLQKVAASVVGRPVQPDPYWVTLDTTIAGLEDEMNNHRDLPLILDESNHYLAGLSEADCLSKMAQLVFKFESAQAKRRKTEPFREPPSRFNYLISSNDSIASMARHSRAEGVRAACDRLLSLAIDDDAPYGVFESLPAGFSSSYDLATSILAGATRNYGHPFRTFARRLAALRWKDEPALRQRIATHLATFRRRIDVDENDGSAVRTADAFGIVAAAGLAGIEFGVLPQTFRPLEVAVATYRRNRSIAFIEPATERLKRHIDHNDLPVVDRDHLLAISRSNWKRSPGAILIDSDGHKLFVIAPTAFRRAFVDNRNMMADRALQTYMVNESGRVGINKRVRADKSDRVLCWRVPEG